MFEAFKVEPVIDGLGRKIMELAEWEGQLLISLSDGSLLMLQQDQLLSQQHATEAGPTAPWQVMMDAVSPHTVM